jgi:hypothetical protein
MSTGTLALSMLSPTSQAYRDVSQAESKIAPIVRAALEGVPIRAIARIFCLDYTRIVLTLTRAIERGELIKLPRPDWDRSGQAQMYASAAMLQPNELEFTCRQTFKLTSLEAAFLVMLLRSMFAEKEKLHAVVERQRYQRPLRPLEPEVTDPKMVDVMICKLRRKLKNHDPALVVKTSWGKGYYLETATKALILKCLVP